MHDECQSPFNQECNHNFPFDEDDDVKTLHTMTSVNGQVGEATSYPVRGKHSRSVTLVRTLMSVLIIILAILVVFIMLYVNARRGSRKLDAVCGSPECVQISSRLIENMDTSVDPCDNFYQYACGGWLKHTPIPDSRTRYSRFEKLAEENAIVLKQILIQLENGERKATTPYLNDASTYYKTCMDTKTIEKIGDAPMKEAVSQLGSWPVTDENFNSSTWNLMKSLVDVHTNISQAPVFNLYVTSDIKNSNENIIIFDQAGIMMDRDSYLGNTTYHAKRREAYVDMMKKIVIEMGANETGVKLMEKIFEFEVKLAEITMPVVERRNYHAIYESMTLGEFANVTEIPIKWLSEFVDKIFASTGAKVPLTERVVSFSTQYIKKAFKLFMGLSPEVQASYIMWHAVRIMAPIVLGKYQDIFDDFYTKAYGTKDRLPRWQTCVDSTLKAYGYALARPFVEEAYDRTARDMSTELIQAIKRVFKDNLKAMDWMDKKTKDYAQNKAEKMLENIGYPELVMNNTALEQEYKGMPVWDGEHFRNYMEKRTFKNRKNYARRGKPVDKSEWGVLPTVVNAYYAPTENKIGFPAGILQWPFYDKRAPRAVAYGAIGMVVGHEITHGFDDQGKEFTIEGNLDSWWSNHSAREFRKRTECFVKQYSNFTSFGSKTNGKQTLGEDLADNGGLQQSLQAYKLWVTKNGEEVGLPGLDLSPEQLFYLAFAQVWCTAYRESAAINQIENGVHSLSEFRVIGTLQNSVDFSKSYRCPVGSRMNPATKCKVW